jgi:hypothetical protein
MGKATITKVENGYIVELTKVDRLNNRPETSVLIFTDFNAVIEYLTKERF